MLGSERVPLLDSIGRVLAEDVAAPWEMPRYSNSAMDGYAVRTADCAQGKTLPVAGYVPAGAADGGHLQAGTAIRIMTGGPIPEGCDAVVPLEQVGEVEGKIGLTARVDEGQHIRRAGEDVKCGESIATRGTVIRSIEISMLAGFNRVEIEVYKRPRVAIVSTGDELVELGGKLGPGKIVNSNGVALAAAIQEAGCTPLMLGIAADTPESHKAKLADGLKADVLITSAGVSAGDRDFVPEVLAELGVRQVFRGVEVKPGSPTAFGIKDGTPVFSLPGNPVAALVIFEMLVRPALLKIAGHTRVLKRTIRAVLAQGEEKKVGRTRLLRVRLATEAGRTVALSAGDQQTGMLKSLVHSDGIAVLEAERGSYKNGDEVEVVPISDVMWMEESR